MIEILCVLQLLSGRVCASRHSLSFGLSACIESLGRRNLVLLDLVSQCSDHKVCVEYQEIGLVLNLYS